MYGNFTNNILLRTPHHKNDVLGCVDAVLIPPRRFRYLPLRLCSSHEAPVRELCAVRGGDCRVPGRQRKAVCVRALGPVAASLPTATTGWLLASTVLAAVRLGRKQAEDSRVAQLQASAEFFTHQIA